MVLIAVIQSAHGTEAHRDVETMRRLTVKGNVDELTLLEGIWPWGTWLQA